MTHPHPILILDGNGTLGGSVGRALQRGGYTFETCSDTDAAVTRLSGGPIGAVIADLGDRGDPGLSLCRWAQDRGCEVPVLVVAGVESMGLAVEAMRQGAANFLTRPLDRDGLLCQLERALATRPPVGTPRGRDVERAILGNSEPMQRVKELIQRVARTEVTVLISGETGTGKELVARSIHDLSERASGPFVALNCAAIPAELIESELFGHQQGSFTGAERSRLGLFREAEGGTLFLDEIGELPTSMQPKLLRALQEHRVRPVGGEREVPFNTRVIAATNKDLAREVEAGGFRQDLYFRINVVNVTLPPLRERGTDVLLLAQHFVSRFAARYRLPVVGLDKSASQALLDHVWPGNVRELENAIERALTLCRSTKLTSDDLPGRVQSAGGNVVPMIDPRDPESMPTLDEVERRYVKRIFAVVEGNKARAARILGLDRKTLYRRLDRWGIDP